MDFIIRRKHTYTEKKELTAYKLVIFGFESSIQNLTIVFENKNGVIEKFPIPDTRVGFADEDCSYYIQVWFEYTATDKEYLIDLQVH
jgi:hypothetical protein